MHRNSGLFYVVQVQGLVGKISIEAFVGRIGIEGFVRKISIEGFVRKIIKKDLVGNIDIEGFVRKIIIEGLVGKISIYVVQVLPGGASETMSVCVCLCLSVSVCVVCVSRRHPLLMLCRRAMSGRERPRTDHTLPLRPMTVVSCGTETQFQHQGPGQKGNLLATRRPSRSRRRRLAQTLGLYSKGTHSIDREHIL